MDDLALPSTAIYAGGLAHTFEYHTTGVHATPHLHWSFPLREEATITCPVLVAQNVVYVGDSAGFLSALDAHSGDLLWCFATDWARDGRESDLPYESTGVAAFCLAGRLGYVASAYHTLYELDLSNGQVIRSWNREALEEDPDETEEEIFSLFFYDRLVWINYCIREFGYMRTSRLDPATGSMVLPERFPDGFFASGDGAPVIYSHPQGNFDVAYIAEVLDSNARNCAFYAINLSLFGPLSSLHESAEGNNADPILWSMGEEAEDKDEDDEVYYNGLFTILDETLYAVCRRRSPDDDDILRPKYKLLDELLALDPFTGTVQWCYTIPKDEHPIQVAAASRLIFLVTRYGIEAVDTHTHQRGWTWTSKRDGRHVLIADGLLFVLDRAGQITALDIHTGEHRWNLQTEQPITGPLSTIADATLYLVMDHTLCAFRTS